MSKKKSNSANEFLPKRSNEHITGERAVLEFRRSLPREWIVREVSGDYGIDCEIEVVDDEGAVTGARILAQLKGTASAEVKAQGIVQVKTSTVRYWASLPIPVILVRVTDNPLKVIWLDVRE
ncbi:MAG: DUF4365 domain-containing protein, partial [Isosphaeraceae bacterium]